MAEIGPRSGVARGQMFLITAIGLAITLVALALVLNTAIFTENLATRGSDRAGGLDAVRYRVAAEGGTRDVLSHVNYHNNTTHADLHTNLTTGIDEWSNATTRLYAIDSRSVSVTGTTTNGTRIVQDQAGRNLTERDPDGDGRWVVAGSVTNTRQFWINVSRDSLNVSEPSDLDSDTVFHLELDHAGTDMAVYLYRSEDDPNDVNVTVAEDGGPVEGTCSATGEHVIVNITAATHGGADCAPLAVMGDLSTPYEIEIEQATYTAGSGGDTAMGTYELIVDDPSVSGSNYYDDTAGESPFVTPAIYAVTIDVWYEAPRIAYNTSVRLAPGEHA